MADQTGVSPLLDAAIGIVKDAIEADKDKQYQEAYTLYSQAVQMFLKAFKRT